MPEPEESDIADEVASFYADPFGFVLWAFDWGHGVLTGFDGPEDWQREYLEDVGRQVSVRGFGGVTPVDPIRFATASGHGIGKSSLTAWLILWIMATRPNAKGIVTATTAPQLETKTFAELAKWTKLCVVGHWFKLNTGKGNLRIAHVLSPETWRCDGQTCKEENSESFAGLHNAGSTPFYIYDEASGVPDKIWDVSEGGMTDGEPMWFVFGNPTKNSGRFRECFGRFRGRWVTRQIDSRTVRLTNKREIGEWEKYYGVDSDFFRVRVLGVFPRVSSMQFVPGDLVQAAMSAEREPVVTHMDPVTMGVDVGRFGDDASVIYIRRGRDARTVAPFKYRGIDTMVLAAEISRLHDLYRPDMIAIDEGGVGGGVVDRCRMLRLPVVGVQFGEKPTGSMQISEGAISFANRRAEMWGVMRDWLKGGILPDDPDLASDLTGLEYGYRLVDGRDCIQLERKEDMKKRGLASPDIADALALTFAFPVQPSDHVSVLAGRSRAGQIEVDYNPLQKIKNVGRMDEGPKRQNWMPGALR